MPICIECGQSLAEITKIENGVRVLANCSNCQSPSDAFAEMDGVQTSIALMLLHKKAYRHTLFNVPILLKPLIILVMLSCVLESYVGVVQNSYLSFFRENHHLIFSSGDFANVVGLEERGGGGGEEGSVLLHPSAPMLQLGESPPKEETIGGSGDDGRDLYSVGAGQREYQHLIDDDFNKNNHHHTKNNINNEERDAIRNTGDGILVHEASSSKRMGSLLRKTLKKTALKLLLSTGELDVLESSSASSTSQSHSSHAASVSPTSSSSACAASTTTTCAYIPAHKGEDALGGETEREDQQAVCGRGTDVADSTEVEEGQKCQNQALMDSSVRDRDDSEGDYVDEVRSNGASGDRDEDAAMAAARAAAVAAAATANQTLHFVKRFLTRGPSLQLVEVVRQHQLLKIVPFFTAIPKMLFFQLLEFVFLLAVLAWVGTALITRVDYPTIASTSSSSPADNAAAANANSGNNAKSEGASKASSVTATAHKAPAPSAPLPHLPSSKNESFASSSRSPSKAPSSSATQQSSSPAYIVTHNKSYTELLRVLLRVLAISSASKLGYLLFLVWDMPFYLVGLVETYQFIILFAALRGARASFRAAFCATFMCLCAKYFFRLLMKSLPPFLASVSFQIMFMRT